MSNYMSDIISQLPPDSSNLIDAMSTMKLLHMREGSPCPPHMIQCRSTSRSKGHHLEGHYAFPTNLWPQLSNSLRLWKHIARVYVDFREMETLQFRQGRKSSKLQILDNHQTMCIYAIKKWITTRTNTTHRLIHMPCPLLDANWACPYPVRAWQVLIRPQLDRDNPAAPQKNFLAQTYNEMVF